MISADSRDSAVLALGAASVASVVFTVDGLGDFQFMRVGGASAVIAVAVGVVACAAGLLARPALAVVAGVAFLTAAVVQVVSTATGNDWLGANLSTMSFWLGLGVGLLAVGVARRTPTHQHRREDSG